VQMLASSQMPELVVSASQPQAGGVGGGRGDIGGGGGRSFASAGRQGQGAPPPPNGFGGMLGSSQSLGPAAASQAVAGKFGGRPPVKKKRKQGF
jgi:hypothetical protein